MRQARRVLIALAAVCALLAAIAPMADAQVGGSDDSVKPEVFAGDAAATGVSIEMNREALLPVPDVFKFIGLDGLSNYGSSSQAARASLFFPGNGVLTGPGLVCGTFGGQFPAEFKPILDTCLKYNYPLTVFADEFRPDVSTTGSLNLGKPSDDISADATMARAHAAEDGVNTDAVLQDLRVLGIPPFGPTTIPGVSDQLKLDTSIVDIDSSTARTDHRIVKGALVTVSTVKMSGIKLIGGLIRIGSLTSESRVSDNAAGKRTADATFQTTGVTVAGVPAQITNKGIVFGSPDNNVPIPAQVTDAAKAVLKTLSVTVSTLPTEEALDKDGAARASVGGIIIEYARDAQGLPLLPSPIGGEVDPNGMYTLTVQLGLTGAVGVADNYGLDADESIDNIGDTLDDAGDFGDFTGGDFGSSDPGSFSDSSGNLAGGPIGVGGRSTDANANPSLVRSISQGFGGRLGFLYLTLMFAVLALCITPRLVVPPRLPGRND